MSRIAFYLPHLGSSGAEASALWIARELGSRGHDVVVIADRRSETPQSGEGFAVRVLDTAHSALAGPALAKAVKAAAPDILIPVTTANILTAAAAKRLGWIKTPLIAWEHDILSSARASRRARGSMEVQLIRSLYGLCDRVVFTSRGAAQDGAVFCAPQAINSMHIYRPAQINAPQPLSPAERTIATRLKAPRIATLGPLTDEKDLRTLLRAFQYWSRTNSGSLLVMGDGPQRKSLESAATGFGLGDKVIFAGQVQEPANLLAVCDLYVSTATFDPYGENLLQALALGLPIIAADCPVAPREILDGGRYGRLFLPGDSQSLAKAIRESLAALPDRVALRGRSRDFSVERAADAFLAAAGLNVTDLAQQQALPAA